MEPRTRRTADTAPVRQRTSGPKRAARWLTLAVVITATLGCQKVTLVSDVTDRELTYTCGFVRPQAQTSEDRKILAANYTDVMRYAEKNYLEAEKLALREAYDGGSTVALERAIVQFHCDHEMD